MPALVAVAVTMLFQSLIGRLRTVAYDRVLTGIGYGFNPL